MIGLKRGSVKLTAHQKEWYKEAKQTITELKNLLEGCAVDIQHIGSTAVSSIHAKPIIDIVVGVCDLEDIFSFIEKLSHNKYIFRGEDVTAFTFNESDTVYTKWIPNGTVIYNAPAVQRVYASNDEILAFGNYIDEKTGVPVTAQWVEQNKRLNELMEIYNEKFCK